jgi:diadenosine tetraphosphate (Ap4A) HIT family hydrolase
VWARGLLVPLQDGALAAPVMPVSCAICQLHGDGHAREAFEIGRGELWLLRHHPDPAPLAGWLLLDARRHLGGPLDFNDSEAVAWGAAVRHGCQLVQRLTGCERVYAIAFGEGAPHLHLHLIPRHAADPASAAWAVADLYRAMVAGERPPADPARVRELVARARQLVEMGVLDGS